ncbi:MAG: hypothetical protein KBS41_00530 [Oscillospiraceae bacterium]|nr:hypothetical protein [Candidatus Equicaccousia limihippi]
MKKIVAIVLSVALMLSLSAVAFADVFVGSPSNTNVPKLVDYKSSNPKWDGKVVITGYGDRKNLTPEKQKAIEEAYDQAKDAKDITDLSPELKKIAENNNIKPENLLISDLFDLSYINGQVTDHGVFTIKLDPATKQKFVALMQFDGNEWKIVDSAKLDGEILTFTAEELNEFAIVVNGGVSPKTAQNDVTLLYVAILMAVAGASVVVFKFGKKCEQN